MNLTKDIIEAGAPVVVTAVFLYLVVKYFPFFIQAFKEFIQQSANFTNVMQNHIHDNTDAVKSLTEAINNLCAFLYKDEDKRG